MKTKRSAAASPVWLTVRVPSFFPSFAGVPGMIAGGADRLWSGSSTGLSLPEYVGSGPKRKGAVSCWDAESGLEVMGRREKEPCLWRGTKWITAIFLLLCLTVWVESGGPDNKSTETTNANKMESKKKKKLPGRVDIMSFMMIWLNVWWGRSHFRPVFFHFSAPTRLV